MKKLISLIFVVCLAQFSGVANAGMFSKDGPEQQRQQIEEARGAALTKLYAEKPSAKAEIQGAVGYAVFSSVGVNVFVVATERGGGILKDNATGEETYMKMFSAGGGVGMGVKDFDAVFVFHTEEAMQQFQQEGWDFSGKADASAESEDKGMGTEAAVTAVPGTTIYQLTDAGLALQATLQGTKFWADDELN
jgi:lipid-binding SYLF domain-containing protein